MPFINRTVYIYIYGLYIVLFSSLPLLFLYRALRSIPRDIVITLRYILARLYSYSLESYYNYNYIYILLNLRLVCVACVYRLYTRAQRVALYNDKERERESFPTMRNGAAVLFMYNLLCGNSTMLL